MAKKDYIFRYDNEGSSIGHIPGSEKVLFIKTGQGGSVYGDGNKYLNLAYEINEKYGFTVFVSETDSDSEESYDRDMAILDSLFVNKGYEIYYLGVSKGGIIGIWYGSKNKKIKKVLTINAPMMINFYNKTRPAALSLGGRLAMVYGALDPSYKYIPFIPSGINVRILDGADHNMIGAKVTLAELIEDLLFE